MTEKTYAGLPYIPNKAVYAAVKFAQWLINHDTPSSIAIKKAAKKYRVNPGTVHGYIFRWRRTTTNNQGDVCLS